MGHRSSHASTITQPVSIVHGIICTKDSLGIFGLSAWMPGTSSTMITARPLKQKTGSEGVRCAMLSYTHMVKCQSIWLRGLSDLCSTAKERRRETHQWRNQGPELSVTKRMVTKSPMTPTF